MIVVSREWFRVGMIVVNNDSGVGALGGPKPQFSGLFVTSAWGGPKPSGLFVTPMRAWDCGGGGGGAESSKTECLSVTAPPPPPPPPPGPHGSDKKT